MQHTMTKRDRSVFPALQIHSRFWARFGAGVIGPEALARQGFCQDWIAIADACRLDFFLASDRPALYHIALIPTNSRSLIHPPSHVE